MGGITHTDPYANHTTAVCVTPCRRVTHTIELREKEEQLRKLNLRLERSQTNATIAACDDARGCAVDAHARLVPAGQSDPLAVASLIRYASTVHRVMPFSELTDQAFDPLCAPYHVVQLLPGHCIWTKCVASDSDADRVWRTLQNGHTDASWNERMKRCVVQPMFDTQSPLQNLPGRSHLSCALLYCITVNGERSRRYARMVAPMLRDAVHKMARLVVSARPS